MLSDIKTLHIYLHIFRHGFFVLEKSGKQLLNFPFLKLIWIKNRVDRGIFDWDVLHSNTWSSQPEPVPTAINLRIKEIFYKELKATSLLPNTFQIPLHPQILRPSHLQHESWLCIAAMSSGLSRLFLKSIYLGSVDPTAGAKATTSGCRLSTAR